MRTLASRFFLLLAFLSFNVSADTENPVVKLSTNKGDIEIELYQSKTPVTVKNFLEYVNSGFYNGTIFHRVIPNFMIQGGGFSKGLERKQPLAPIINEANAFIPNVRGTISMARTQDPNSATSQFFINTVNNKSLNRSSVDAGYAVFGKVIKGMEVVDLISAKKTGTQKGFRDVPVETIEVISAIELKETKVDQEEASAESDDAYDY